MRRIVLSGDKQMVTEKLEEALADLKEDDRGFVQARGYGDTPACEVEFAGEDPAEDTEGDWSELDVRYEEVPD